MKKFTTIMLITMLAISFLVIGNTKAEAMNNESAAMLAGAIAIFGRPILNAIAQDMMYPGQVYAPAYPAQYRYAYPATRYIERTRIIYANPRHERFCRHWRGDHRRGYRDEWRHREYRREREDTYKNYRDYHDDD